MTNFAFSCTFITTKSKEQTALSMTLNVRVRSGSNFQMWVMSDEHNKPPRCCVLFPCLNKIHPNTHLHKEEAWHDVGAGLLQAFVIRKVPHHPPLCWQLTANHLQGQRSLQSFSFHCSVRDKGICWLQSCCAVGGQTPSCTANVERDTI